MESSTTMFSLAFSVLAAFFALCLGLSAAQSAEDIRAISDQLWQADLNRVTGDDLQYSTGSAPLFTYVNEARFSGPTFSTFIALLDNYNHDVGVPDACGLPCRDEESAFLDAIVNTRPILLLHNWLYFQGLAPQSVLGFKEQMRQYFFTQYSRTAGPLDSSGFEHVFLGETEGAIATGLHNWIVAYFREKSGDFVYGSLLNTCPSEVLSISFNYYGAYNPGSAMFMRTSPELEVALYTLCLSVHNGVNCPARRNGVDVTMTSLERTGVPKTIDTAHPNC